MSGVEHWTCKNDASERTTADQLVGIAMSAGGLRPLRQLLTRLPETFPAAIVVVQHVGRFSNLPTILRPSLPFPVKFAEPDEPLRSATVYVSPPARHIVVNPHRTIGLSDAARVRCQRPSADWFFRSMADSFQGHGIGVMLSGALDDGARGIRFVHRAGGIVIVQDPRTSVHAGMPLAAIATGVVDHVLPPEAIGPALSALISTADRQRAAREWAEPFASV